MAYIFSEKETFDAQRFQTGHMEKHADWSLTFWATKRVFDIVISLCLLPALAVFYIGLLTVNPFVNPGPIIFSQIRMGRQCKPFVTYKFRSMHVLKHYNRGPEDPLEISRITKLGAFMRKTRIDELPQIINVLQGKMSLIGPRPDYISHARSFARKIPEYRSRHCIRPGISGLAQVELGYAEGIEATRRKAQTDLYYIENAGFRLEARVIWKTLMTVLTKAGV